MKPDLSLLKLAQPPRRKWISYFVLVVSLLLTALATYYVAKTAEDKDRIRFENAVQRTQDDIKNRLETYIALLRAGSGLFAASSEVSRDEFRAFVSALELRRRYPGIQGIGFSVRVKPEEKDALVAQMHAQGDENFTIRPESVRAEYHSIIYIEPLDQRNAAAIGFDMFTEPVRRAAMERARDTGAPAASGRVTLVQEIDKQKQAGFLIYVPVYRNGLALQTVAERQAALRGFVYSPFRADDLLEKIFGSEKYPFVNFQIYDGSNLSPEKLLHRSNRNSTFNGLSYRPRFTATTTIDVAGRPWSIAFASRPEFDRTSARSLMPYIASGGLLISFVLFGVTQSQARARKTAERSAVAARSSEAALRESEARLRRLVEELAQANRLKDDFLAIVSHELRTPLNAILGWVTLLRTRKFDELKTAQALETIERNARLQTQLIEDLLDISRLIRGKVRLNMRPLDLAPVIAAAINSVQPSAEAKNIQIKLAIAPDLGQVSGDSDRLQQIVWNLLSNAVKFTPVGGQIEVRVNPVDTYAQIQVSDTGKGISVDFLPYVFERFRQAENASTRSNSGLGLGLAIVRQLVELHGGTVFAASPGEGQGATFTVKLPLLEGSRGRIRQGEQGESGKTDSLCEHSSPASPVPCASHALNNLRVLIVDDEADTREVVTTGLEQYGAKVTAAASVSEALKALQQSPPDVLISDIEMPDEDGYTLIRKVRQQGTQIPALALTAYAREQDREQAIAAGFQQHISKPVEPAELAAVVARLLKIDC